MRYAFVSDIHANLPAWNTVLADLAVHRVDRIVCLGDVVGYGPQPAECLRGVYAHVHQMVLGNHDAVVAGKMSAESFNDRAQRMIEWTQTRLGENARALFSALPLVLKGPGFRCTHGDFTDPAVFNYVRTEDDARANFAAVPEQLLFCGHTHEAAVFLTGGSGNVYKIEPQDFELEEGKRYLVNVGSVGSARDGDPRASYVIYDEERRGVYFHRVPFDFGAFRSAVAAAPGLDPDLVPFLRAAARGGTAAAVREDEDFSPAAAVRVEGGALEADVGRALRRSNARLRAAALLLAAGCAAALALAAAAWSTLRSHAVSYPPQDAPEIALHELERIGFIRNLRITAEHVSFRFRDPQIRAWLRDVGRGLETYVYKACLDAGIFDDVRLSVIVDWEGENKSNSVSNELDVMCCRGVVPLFISCKTCDVKTEALNELAVLRDRFGGEMARAAIITAERGNARMRNRAAELNIQVVELNDLAADKLQQRLKRCMNV